MKHYTLYAIVIFLLGFQLSDQAFAGTRGRRFIEDDTNDAEVRCQREKLKKKNLGNKYVAPKICDPNLRTSKQRNCLDRDCDIETGHIRY
ncbi:MAG: hypothetical protein A2Z91_00500 [Deltaproteobacteria bacterium GWA2_38_16]|nr:MAG: hypothetical protein A2Z91_00500 [Deltaproteobacteria bacterium GWA2_38_16]OGQ03581.1 MAG: hypothetical protein A3D19_01905 [Deltaproteobacteria bacterium RIFCSPHIGHO2_02_FULL_38_15]OGQ30159.1 MAG: hypothetical protein A3A72_01525 [Deltaproteobacteria bacterium RIFCSPLOWO2_01_FULL_38_9]OGQ64036.1 MAG: hypothetical protein A3G92_01165 [Deltaproteobacteria bacterium RIFCSPLOWO2_12_FULL_38_8]HBQ21176.1 hypothetical protein [Deltaproteobacteria bacterium]